MYTHLHVTQLVLLSFLLLTILSKTTMTDSGLGNIAQKQLAEIAEGLTKDGLAQLAISRQDSEPLIALTHNIEASSYLRLAKRLVEESGGGHYKRHDYVDILTDLKIENEKIMQDLISQHIMIKG